MDRRPLHMQCHYLYEHVYRRTYSSTRHLFAKPRARTSGTLLDDTTMADDTLSELRPEQELGRMGYLKKERDRTNE